MTDDEEPKSSSGSTAIKKKPSPKRGVLFWLFVLYLVSVAAAAILLFSSVDRFWPATLLAFTPRFFVALPGMGLLVLCLIARRWRLCVAILVVLGIQPFILGDFQTPDSACGKGHTDKVIRVLTQNSLRQSLKGQWLADIVKKERLDLIFVQECEVRDLPGGQFDPVGEVESPLAGFDLKVDINNCVLSRFPIKSVDARNRQDVWDRGGSGGVALYEIAAPFGSIWVANVHLATVRQGIGGFRQFGLGGISTLKENTELRQWESTIAREWTERAKGPLIVAGDFNMPRESAIFQASWGSLGDAFETCGWGYGYSKETHTHRIEFGTRIDHVLFDKSFGCDAVSLAPEMGSDHRGVIAELYLR